MVLPACQAMATPGDELTVTGTLVNLRRGPSLDAPVVMRLEQGRRLIEIRREGGWVEVKPVHNDTGPIWVHEKLVEKIAASMPEPVLENPAAEKAALFNLFDRAFREMKENIQRQTGNTYFLKAEDLGGGTVEVTATAAWLNSPREKREEDLSELFRIWDAVMVDKSHITVFIVDENGERLMSMFR